MSWLNGYTSNWLKTILVCFFLVAVPTILELSLLLISSKAQDVNLGFEIKHGAKELINFIPFVFLFSLLGFIQGKPRLLSSILLVFLFLETILECSHIWVFGGKLNAPAFASVFNTNSAETGAFLSNYLSFQLILVLSGIGSIGVLFFVRIRRSVKVKWALLVHGGMLFIYFGLLLSGRSLPMEIDFIPIAKTIKHYSNFKEEERKLLNARSEERPVQVFSTLNEEAELHVIIIGESLSAKHMSCYGYDRPTTPHFESEQWLKIGKANTPNAHTVPALTKVFSGGNTLEDDAFYEQPNLIDILKRAGYSIEWMSNQGLIGEHETPISMMANICDRKTYVNPSGGQVLDERLKEAFSERTPLGDKEVVIIHLMGSHMDYSDRYHSSFQVFDGDDLNRPELDKEKRKKLNAYDNSVIYTDHVVEEIRKEVEKLGRRSTITFLADHGDEVYDFRDFCGHSDVLFSEFMEHVPLMIWSSEEMEIENIDLPSLNYSEFDMEHFLYFYQDILGIKTEFVKDEYFKVARTEVPLVSRSTGIDLELSSRIWAHRVNGLQRAHEISELNIEGIEIDVVVDLKKEILDVNHPPALSIELSLLDLVAKNPRGEFWIDTKNLNRDNLNWFLKRMDEISNNYPGAKLLIETNNHHILRKLKDHRIDVIYYLPHFETLENEAVKDSLGQVLRVVEEVQPSALSQSASNYKFLKTHFPNYQLCLFDTSLDWFSEEDQKRAGELLKDSLIQCLLMRVDTENWR